MTTKQTQEMARKALKALEQAVADALERKRRLGQYAVVNRDGEPFLLYPEGDGKVQKEETAERNRD